MEADKLGMEVILAAGYDPDEVPLLSNIHNLYVALQHFENSHYQALKFWRLVAPSHPGGPAFLWDHPHPHHRWLDMMRIVILRECLL